jgi:metallo-beta-lactamase family protein
VERAQELIADLTTLMMEGDVPFCPIHVDSPMAGKATAIFRRHAAELENGHALVAGLKDHHLRFTETVEQSRALAQARGFHIILAASGMCEAGRIRHHLKNWLAREAATLLLVGYQAEATLGRLLQDGVPHVRIQGEEFPVRARVRSIDLYSGHADGPELAQWVAERMPVRQGVFLVHGEEAAMEGMVARLAGLMPAERLVCPALDEGFALTGAGFVRQAQAVAPRLAPEQVARLDWHNDVSRLILDINEALRAETDERGRAVLIRRLRRALEEGEGLPPPRVPGRRRH